MTKARILADYVAGGTTASEFDYMDGVTSNVQTQMDAKLATTTASSTYAPKASPTFTGSFTFTPTSSIPASPTEGMMYYESDEDTIMVYGGTSDGSASWFPLNRKITGGHITTYTDTNNYRSHTFLSSGTFYTPVALTVDVLLVGGGGGGGALGGGGGAGEFKTVTSLAISAGDAIGIQCGTGGLSSGSYGYLGLRGGITIMGAYNAYGGAGGGSYNGYGGGSGEISGTFTANSINARGSGGGGGAGTGGNTAGGAGGTGGNNGGAGKGSGSPYEGGGGGGAGGVGGDQPNGTGGAGLANRYRDGTDVYYAGGGNGVGGSVAPNSANLYGGGGAAQSSADGSGRPGCVIIRYQI